MRKLAWILIAAMILQLTDAATVNVMAAGSGVALEAQNESAVSGKVSEEPGKYQAEPSGEEDPESGEPTSNPGSEESKEGSEENPDGKEESGENPDREEPGENPDGKEESGENPDKEEPGENPDGKEESGENSDGEKPGENPDGEEPGENPDGEEESEENPNAEEEPGEDMDGEEQVKETDEEELEEELATLYAAAAENTDVLLLSFNKYYSEGEGYPVMAGIIVPVSYFDGRTNNAPEMVSVRYSVDSGEVVEFPVVNKITSSVKDGYASSAPVIAYNISGYFGYYKNVTPGSHTVTYEFKVRDKDGKEYFITKSAEAEFIDEEAKGEVIVASQSTEYNKNYMSGKKGAKVYKIRTYSNIYRSKDEKVRSISFRNHETKKEYSTPFVFKNEVTQYIYETYDGRYSCSAKYEEQTVYLEVYNLLPKDIYKGDSSTYTIELDEELPEGYYDVIFITNKDRKLVSENDYYAVTRPTVLYVERSDITSKNKNEDGSAAGISVPADVTGNYVSVFVYGFNLTRENIPVFYKYESDNTDPLTLENITYDEYTGYEEYENGLDFCVRKVDPGSSEWDGLKRLAARDGYMSIPVSYNVKVQGQNVIDPDTVLNYCPQMYNRLEYIDQAKSGLTKRLRIYLNGGIQEVSKGATIHVKEYVYTSNQEKTYQDSSKIQMDSDGEYYLEFKDNKEIYQRAKEASSICISQSSSFPDSNQTEWIWLAEPDLLKPVYADNLNVPSGGRWEIHEVCQVAKTVYSGTNSGSAVMDGSTVQALSDTGKQYRVCTYNADGSVAERKLVYFYAPKAVPVTGIRLNKTMTYVAMGDKLQMTATVSPANATNKAVNWSSDDESVAVVSETGEVTGVGIGETTITAATTSGRAVAVTCRIVVLDPNGEDFTFDLSSGEPQTESVAVNDAYKKDASYQSSNNSVVTVSSAGIVTPAGVGTAQVYAKLGDVRIRHTVTVINLLTGIDFEDEEVELETGKTVWNAVIYTPVYTSDSKALTVSVVDSSVATAEVSGRYVIITGNREGTTTITAKAGACEAVCTVTVEEPAVSPEACTAYALTNRDKKLGDIQAQLPKGYAFQDPEINLAQFAGSSEKEFAVTYTDARGKTASGICKVYFLTIVGIDVSLDKATVAKGEDGILTPKVNWSGYDATDAADKREEYLEGYTWEVTPNNAGIVEIEDKKDGRFSYRGLGAGKVTLTITLREAGTTGTTGILFKKTATVQVTDSNDSSAVIVIEKVEGADYIEAQDHFVVELPGATDATPVVITASVEGYTLAWSSSDTAIVSPGKTTRSSDTQDFVTPLTIKSTGRVELTATANDKAKTQKTIVLYVLDTKPSVDSAVTINKAMTGGATIGIFADVNSSLVNQYYISLKKYDDKQNEERFAIDYNSSLGLYEVTLIDNTINTETYKVLVEVTVNTGGVSKTTYSPLDITVVDKPVTYSVKQSKKVNLFYNDEQGNGLLAVSGKNAVLESVELTECSFDYDMTTGAVSCRNGTGTDIANLDKDGTLEITFAGYKTVKTNVQISTETKKPKITTSASSSVLYPNAGITSARIQLFENGELISVEEGDTIAQDNLEQDSYQVQTKDGSIVYMLKEGVVAPKSAKISFDLQRSNWNDDIPVSHTLKSNAAANPQLKLSSTTITLNNNAGLSRYQNGEVNVTVKGATDLAVDSVSLAGADVKSRNAINTGLDFGFEDETGTMDMWFNKGSDVKAGTYTFNLNASLADGAANANAKLKVKVVDKDVKAVAVSTKGSLDILDRENSFITVTPKLTNLTGTVEGAELTGRDAHLFETELLNDKGQVTVKTRQDTSYITKYAYKVSLVYTLRSGGRTYKVSSKDITVKVKQGKAVISAVLSNCWLHQTAGNAVNIQVGAVNGRSGALEISDVSIEEAKNMKNAFRLVYDETAQCYKLSVTDGKLVKKNKTYTVKLSVRLKDQADNEKKKTISVKVRVK